MLVRALFRQNVPRTHFGRHLVQIRCGQCDQIWQFITIWATLKTCGDYIIGPNGWTFLKGSLSFNF